MSKLKFDAILEDFFTIPRALLDCLSYYLGEGQKLFIQFRSTLERLSITRICLIGHTYNYFASLVAFYYIAQKFGKKTMDCLTYEVNDFLYHFHLNPLWKNTLFVIISESGDSIQIQECFEKIIEARIPSDNIVGVTNNKDSFLTLHTPISFPMKSGAQQVIGSKSYLNTILILYFIARAFQQEEVIPHKVEEEIRNLIFEIKFFSADWEVHLKSMSEFLGTDYDYLYFIAKGASLATAYLAGMNSKSYARIFGQGTNIGLFLHGPFQIVNDSFRCILIISDESSPDDTLRLIDVITNKLGKGRVVFINNSRQLSSLGRANPNVWIFEHTTKNSSLAPIFEILVIQYLLLDQALRRGVVE